jgi:fructokinase
MHTYDITTLGEILIDFTPSGKSEGGRNIFEENPGGAPANVAAAAAKLGAKTAFIGKTGADQFGLDARDALAACGVYTGAMKEAPFLHTTFAFVTLSSSGERSFTFARNGGADITLAPEELDRTVIENSTFLHIGSLSLTGEPSHSATLEAVRIAKKSGVFVSYDPNWREPLWNNKSTGIETMKSMFKYADVVKISDNELELIYGVNNPSAAQNILDEGVKLICVTLGKDGVFYKTENFEGIISIPEYNIKTADTTGAGDSFTGALLYRLTRKDNPLSFTQEELSADLNFANAAATLCVSRRGAIPALASLDEVNNLMETLG